MPGFLIEPSTKHYNIISCFPYVKARNHESRFHILCLNTVESAKPRGVPTSMTLLFLRPSVIEANNGWTPMAMERYIWHLCLKVQLFYEYLVLELDVSLHKGCTSEDTWTSKMFGHQVNFKVNMEHDRFSLIRLCFPFIQVTTTRLPPRTKWGTLKLSWPFTSELC